MAQSSSSSLAATTIVLLVVVLLAQLATIATAQGGEIIDVFRWTVPYSGIKEVQANVGDTIVFRWAQGMHNVFIHPTMNCDLEGVIFVGSQPGSEYTFTAEDGSVEGNDMFFGCDIGAGAHCKAGQSILVKVFTGGATTPPTDPVTSSDTTSGTINDMNMTDTVTDVISDFMDEIMDMDMETDADDNVTPDVPTSGVESVTPAGSINVANEAVANSSTSSSRRLNSVAMAMSLVGAFVALVL